MLLSPALLATLSVYFLIIQFSMYIILILGSFLILTLNSCLLPIYSSSSLFGLHSPSILMVIPSVTDLPPLVFLSAVHGTKSLSYLYKSLPLFLLYFLQIGLWAVITRSFPWWALRYVYCMVISTHILWIGLGTFKTVFSIWKAYQTLRNNFYMK